MVVAMLEGRIAPGLQIVRVGRWLMGWADVTPSRFKYTLKSRPKLDRGKNRYRENTLGRT